MEFLTTKQASELWGISPRRIALLCEQGRITGAVKAGKTWLLPPDAKKPMDKRLKKNSSKAEEE
ncbi:MAG: helix-turn-helix domain-containing protein [Ruthenibacterium sp.]